MTHEFPVLSIKEAAEYLRSSRGQIYALLRRGELDAVKVGGRTLIHRTDLQRLIGTAGKPFVPGIARNPAGRGRRADPDLGIFG